MAGRFTARRSAGSAAGAGCGRGTAAGARGHVLDGVSGAGARAGRRLPAAPRRIRCTADKLLDAKVRLHRRLIEEINLSGAGKAARRRDARSISSSSSRQYVVSRAARAQHAGAERIRRRNPRRDDGLGPLEPLLKDPTHQRHPDQRPRMHLCRARRPAGAGRLPLQGRGASAAHHQQDRLGGRPPGR